MSYYHRGDIYSNNLYKKFSEKDYYPDEKDYQLFENFLYRKLNLFSKGYSKREFSNFYYEIQESYNYMNYFKTFKKSIENFLFLLDVTEKNKNFFYFDEIELLAFFSVIFLKHLGLPDKIKEFLEKNKVYSSLLKEEVKKLNEMIDFCINSTNYKILIEREVLDRSSFIKILLKLSEESYYFRSFSINYSWILMYYQDYEANSHIYINKIQTSYIKNYVKPSLDYLINKKILGLYEYQKNLINNYELWSTNKNVTREEFIKGVY